MLAVKMENITVSFPGVKANDNVNLSVRKGTIHCLLGENGSGKTTLMNVLFGLYHKDSGDVYINEEKVEIKSPLDAEKCGIGMVHQHFMLIPRLSVLENIILGSEPGKIIIDKNEAERKVSSIIEKYNFSIDLNQKVKDISVGMKQKVEILKLLYRDAKILIFDEPTAVLTPQEDEELFKIFHSLTSEGCTIIFITHKLNEIFSVSDEVTVLRKGKYVGTRGISTLTPSILSEMMIGRVIEEKKELSVVKKGSVKIEVKNLVLKNNSLPISFSISQGEILGIAGIDGNGQEELENMIIGMKKFSKGSIFLDEKDISSLSVKERREKGIAYIPSDRFQSGALLNASVKENFLLSHQDSLRYKKHGFVKYKNLEEDCLKYKDLYDISLVDIEEKFSSLSGGNQQKVVLSREVEKDVSFVLASQPCRGLDISAIEFIHNNLLRLRREGKAILLISAELSELLELSDRILVLYDGNVTGSFEREDFNENEIGLRMLGKVEGEKC